MLRAFGLLMGCYFSATLAQMNACIDGTQGMFVIDYPTVEITAELRLNGAPFMTQPANSVGIWLVQNGVQQMRIAQSHLPPQPVRVAVGTYDLLYVNFTQTDPTLPQNALAIFQEDIEIDSDGVLVADIPSVEIGGEVTLNGVPFPTSPVTEGEIYAQKSDRLSEVFLGSTIDGDISITPIGAVLIAGTYDLFYRNILSASVVPMNQNAIVATMPFNSDNLTLEIDMVSHEVSGEYLVNGVLAPPSPVANGNIELRRALRREIEDIVEVGPTMNQTFTIRALAGTYNAHYFRVNAAGVVPWNNHSIAQIGIAIDGSPIDINIPSVDYEGDFMIDGLIAPPSPVETGEVLFLDRSTGTETRIDDTDSQSFAFRAIPGTYDLLYRHTVGGTIVPQNELALIAQNQVFASSPLPVQLPIEMFTTDTTIEFSLNNDTWAPAAGVADLAMLNADGTTSLVLGDSTMIPFSRRLMSNPYRVSYDYVSGDLIPINSNSVLPQTQTPQGAMATIHYDVPSLEVTPTALINGGPFPMPESAFLAFLKQGVPVVPFGAANGQWPARHVLQGHYVIRYSHAEGGAIPLNFWHTQNCINVELCMLCSGFEASIR